MKEKKFSYTKKNGEQGNYNVLVLNEGTDYLNGIDLNKLNEEEVKKVKEIQKEYEEKLKPYMKAFRKFIVENILEE